MSRKGATSARAQCPTSDSLNSSPATKAPKAADNPTKLVRAAMAKAMATTIRTNISREPIKVMRLMAHGRTLVPSRAAPPMTAVALSTPQPISRITDPTPPLPSSAGSMAIIGMNIKSCTSRKPVISRPCRLFNSPRSERVFSTTIVLLNAPANPSMTAVFRSNPRRIPIGTKSQAVMTICKMPPMITTLPRCASSRKEISMPMVNTSSTTPSSATVCTDFSSATVAKSSHSSPKRPRTCGPIIIPIAR